MNILLLFYEKILHGKKSKKAPKGSKKYKKAEKSTKKHKKRKKAIEQKHKTQISEQKFKMRLKTSNGKKVTYSFICDFALAKKKIKKPLQWKC